MAGDELPAFEEFLKFSIPGPFRKGRFPGAWVVTRSREKSGPFCRWFWCAPASCLRSSRWRA